MKHTNEFEQLIHEINDLLVATVMLSPHALEVLERVIREEPREMLAQRRVDLAVHASYCPRSGASSDLNEPSARRRAS
jgi:hypothetical protein